MPGAHGQKAGFAGTSVASGLDALRTRAKDHQRSLVGEIIWAVRPYIKQQKQQEGDK